MMYKSEAKEAAKKLLDEKLEDEQKVWLECEEENNRYIAYWEEKTTQPYLFRIFPFVDLEPGDICIFKKSESYVAGFMSGFDANGNVLFVEKTEHAGCIEKSTRPISYVKTGANFFELMGDNDGH